MASAVVTRPCAWNGHVLAPSLAAEAVGSTVLCAGALVGERVLGNANAADEPGFVVVTAASLAAFAFVTVTLGRTRATLLPNCTYAHAADESLSRDHATAIVVAQLAGAALAGLLVGAIAGSPPSDLWGANTTSEAVAALAFVVATRRSDGHSAAMIALVVAAATIAGARFLGLPSVALANGFASLLDGGVLLGAVLAAQMVGVVAGLMLRTLSTTYDVATSVELHA